MKRFFCAFLCIALIFGLTGCRNIGSQDSGEFRILELAENTIPDERNFSVVDGNGNTVLTNTDVQKVLVVFEKSKDRYLELRLTKDGAKKFKKAVKKKDAVLSVALDGNVLTAQSGVSASPVVLDDAEDLSAIVIGEYEDVMDWFNAIT